MSNQNSVGRQGKKGREQGNERATKSARVRERKERKKRESGCEQREQDSGDRVQTEDRYRGREGTRVCVCERERRMSK